MAWDAMFVDLAGNATYEGTKGTADAHMGDESWGEFVEPGGRGSQIADPLDLFGFQAGKDAADAAKAQAEQQSTGGYAGYKADPSAGVGVDAQHPNAGWNPASEEAHQLNVKVAEGIKSGQVTAETAQVLISHNELAPEIKQALGQIIQQAQVSGSVQQQAPEQQMPSQGQEISGLGSVPLAQ